MKKMSYIKISDIDIGNRSRKDMGDIKQLAASIELEGQIQPITVKVQENADKPYLLLAGQRRLKALELLKHDIVAALIYPSDIKTLDEKSIELAENLYRKNFTWAEECKLKDEIHKMQQQNPNAPGWTQTDTANMLGESVGNISKDIAMANALDSLPELAQCKTKKEALNMLNKLNVNYRTAELSKKIEEERANKTADQLRIELTESFIIGDFLQKVKELPDNSFDLIEVDPPYAIDLKNVKKVDAVKTLNYYEVDTSKYIKFIAETIVQCRRVLKENGWLILWFGINPWYKTICDILDAAEFKYNKLPAVWYKGEPGQTNQPQYYLANIYETFFYARKSKNASIVDMGRSNVFFYRPVTAINKVHPTERPIELIQEIINTFTQVDSKILVPFLGSGNTLLAACNCGCEAKGYELNKTYRDTFVLRVYEGDYANYKSHKGGKV